ncbi:hypothetical protein EZS27_023017, partial [termite gut metagenome]
QSLIFAFHTVKVSDFSIYKALFNLFINNALFVNKFKVLADLR